jgi:hypothetical protein
MLNIVRCDRNRNGGGVAVYIRNSIPFRKDLMSDSLGLLCVELETPKSKPLLISTWYRPPDSMQLWVIK